MRPNKAFVKLNFPLFTGIHNCNRVYESIQAQECHVVSSETYSFLDLENSTKNWIFEQMRLLAENWIGNKFKLVGSGKPSEKKYILKHRHKS